MGNGFCCCVPPPQMALDDLLAEKDVLGSNNVATPDDQCAGELSPPLVHEVNFTEQSLQLQHMEVGNKEQKEVESLIEVEQLSVLDNIEKEVAHYGGGQFESDVDSTTTCTLSALEEVFLVGFEEDGGTEEEYEEKAKDGKSDDRQSESMINLRVQANKVSGAGSTTANGLYRWFAAHSRLVMFTEEGRYQIRGDATLSEYGDHYHDCWVIEEIRDNVIRPLYAVASNISASVPSDGWICIEGASPAPRVEEGDERELDEDSGSLEMEESETSIYPFQSSNLPSICDENFLERVSLVEWVV